MDKVKQMKMKDLIENINRFTNDELQDDELIEKFKECNLYYTMYDNMILPIKINSIKIDLMNDEVVFYGDSL